MSALPTEGPLLFIGNHQTIALDLGILIPDVFLSTGRFLRGLTHPAALMVSFTTHIRMTYRVIFSLWVARRHNKHNSSLCQLVVY